MESRFSFGRVFGQSFSVYARNFVPFFILGLLAHAPYFAWQYAVIGVPPEIPSDGPIRERLAAEDAFNAWLADTWPAIIAGMILDTLLAMVAASALSYGVVQEMRGRRAMIGDCIANGMGGLGRTLLVALLVSARIIVGLILLIVPGIIEWCRLWVAIPAAVMEGAGARDAARRSSELTAGVKGTIFGIGFLFIIIVVLLTQVSDWVLARSEIPPSARMFIGLVIGVGVGLWSSVASAVAYYALRMDREHVDIEQIAAVFE